MRLLFDVTAIEKYHSQSQQARVLTENWIKREMYCPCCLNEYISPFPNNTKGVDFFCDNCKNNFQAKSSQTEFRKRILDGEYATMMHIISGDSCPHLFCMQYSSEEQLVRNLFFIPRFFLSVSCIEKRKPLSVTARRAGWIGCNILLDNIPSPGRIYIVKEKKILNKEGVNSQYRRMEYLKFEKPNHGGWTTDVLCCIESLNKSSFTLNEIYSFERRLFKLHPENKHIRDKIRQQLQILRDKNILSFDSAGKYSLR